jgi:nucleoside-diphosphate-sugar epimerase
MNTGIANRRIVLIGGAGFIGHNLALEMKRRGADVSVVDGLQVNNLLSLYCSSYTGKERELYEHILHERLRLLREAKIPLYVEDARDYHRLSHLLSRLKPQVIILLAAVAHASRSNKDPFNTFDHSLRTLENALDNAKNKVEHFIYFSSSMVYGNFDGAAVTEETACNPLGIYGALKFSGEKIVIAYNQVFGLPYTIVRPSALYGERCISRRVAQVFIENAMRNQDVTIMGDGTECLDFTYVGDLVNGICCCVENPNAQNQIFNLTYGQGRSLNEMAGFLKNRFPKIAVQHMARDALTPERGTLSIEKAKRLIGYQPSFPLEKGYARYMDWYQDLFRNLKPSASTTGSQVNE